MKLVDLTGKRFEHLVVLERNGTSSDGKRVLWRCRCVCGLELDVQAGNLKSGNSASCGCVSRQAAAERIRARNRIHGHTSRAGLSPEYVSWLAMRGRCKHPSVGGFKYYGGRGVKVCKRWDKFENFLADMGLKPTKKHSIDRIDPYGDYKPSNCRWATAVEQRRNRR